MSRLPLPLLALTLGCNPVDAIHDFVSARPKESPLPLPPPAPLPGIGQAKEAALVAPINPIVQPLAPPAPSHPMAEVVKVATPTDAATKTAVNAGVHAVSVTPVTLTAAPETAASSPMAKMVMPASNVDRVRVHILRPGETMTAVAHRYGVPLGKLLVANDYTWDDHPVVDAPIRLTTATDGTWTVRRRQHLSEIAETLGTSPATLAAANDITNPDEIYAGQVLVLPTR